MRLCCRDVADVATDAAEGADTGRRNRSLATVAVLLAAAAAIVIGGCASRPAAAATTAGTAGAAATAATAPAAADAAAAALPEQYDLQALTDTFVQLDWMARGRDYFEQFAYLGDSIFIDNLGNMLGFAEPEFPVGTAVVLESRDGAGQVFLRVARALLEEQGTVRTWQLELTGGAAPPVFVEADIGAGGVPLEIRYRDPDSGEPLALQTIISEDYAVALEQMGPAELTRRVREEHEEEVRDDRAMMLEQPRVLGEERITVPAGEFAVYHVLDPATQRRNFDLHLFVSPRVPGYLVRLEWRAAGAEETAATVELVEIGAARSQFAGLEPRRINELDFGGDSQAIQYGSDGTRDDPVLVSAGEVQYGSVAAGEVSYYAVTTSRTGDVFITVDDVFGGEVELVFYERDHEFVDWRTSSQGESMNVEDYYVDGGVALYFTVESHASADGAGTEYAIDVAVDPVLDPTGVRIRGDIYAEADEIQVGQPITAALDGRPVRYFKTHVRRGPNLRVEVRGLTDDVGLRWFDTDDGRYASAGSVTDGRSTTLEVTGLSAGSTAMFYLAGDPERAPGSFELVVTEY